MNATGRVRAAALSLALLVGTQFAPSPGSAAEVVSGRVYVKAADCSLGECSPILWTVSAEANVHSDPDAGSTKKAVLAPPTSITSIGREQHLIAGEARIIARPYRTAAGLDPREVVYILDYKGEGRSSIYQKGKFYTSKIARTRAECNVAGQPDPRYCWVEVLREPPIVETWLKIEIPGGLGTGWVQAGQGNLVREAKD